MVTYSLKLRVELSIEFYVWGLAVVLISCLDGHIFPPDDVKC